MDNNLDNQPNQPEEEISQATSTNLDSPDTVTQRTAAFVGLFNRMEELGIPIEGEEAGLIARHATTEVGINKSHQVNNLADLKVEPENMTTYEFNRILARARTAIKRVMEIRTKYTAIYKKNEEGEIEKGEDGNPIQLGTYGPYFMNRKGRKGILRQIKKNSRASSRPMKASDIIKRNKENIISIGESK